MQNQQGLYGNQAAMICAKCGSPKQTYILQNGAHMLACAGPLNCDGPALQAAAQIDTSKFTAPKP